MGALTMATTNYRGGASIVRARFSPDLRLMPIQFTFSNSYATGGDTGLTLPGGITASKIVNKNLYPTCNGYSFKLDTDNSKVLAYVSGGTEVTSTTDLSALGALTLWFAYPAGA